VKTRSLSRVEGGIVLSLEADGKETLTLDELRTRAQVSPGYARKLAHDLIRKGWLQRVRSGVYLLNPSRRGPDATPDRDPFRIGSRLVRPYYFGYATAAELWGLLPQLGQVYYIVTPAATRAPALGPVQFRIVRTTRARMFGVRALRRRRESLVVSDPERTVLDCLHRPRLAGGMPGVLQIVASAKPRLRWDRLSAYARRLGVRSLEHRLGYLAERVRPELPIPPAWLRRALPHPSDPYLPLGPPREFGRRGVRERRWHLIRNVPDAQLIGEVDLR
jgi:predicted transcriptional regulator of viral defense system